MERAGAAICTNSVAPRRRGGRQNCDESKRPVARAPRGSVCVSQAPRRGLAGQRRLVGAGRFAGGQDLSRCRDSYLVVGGSPPPRTADVRCVRVRPVLPAERRGRHLQPGPGVQPRLLSGGGGL